MIPYLEAIRYVQHNELTGWWEVINSRNKKKNPYKDLKYKTIDMGEIKHMYGSNVTSPNR